MSATQSLALFAIEEQITLGPTILIVETGQPWCSCTFSVVKKPYPDPELGDQGFLHWEQMALHTPMSFASWSYSDPRVAAAGSAP